MHTETNASCCHVTQIYQNLAVLERQPIATNNQHTLQWRPSVRSLPGMRL